jgi:hypothetical protein
MWMAKLLGQVLSMVSPQVKSSLLTWAKEQQVRAATTPNPWDDLLFDFIVVMLS